ncbi:MAG: cyclase family protein, partial [Gammaproteobacteria bacterium]
MWHDDFFIGQIGQIGTQFDALGHVGTRVTFEDGSKKDVFYNGFTREEVLTPAGLQALGVE